MIKAKYILIAILISAFQMPVLLGQEKPSDKLYDYANLTPASVEKDINELALYLKIPAGNDKEIVTTIFYWMALNITYDIEAYMENNLSGISADNTLINRKSVCQGYAELFHELCKAAGIESVVITGYAKGYSYSGKPFKEPNHAWNAVKINGQWELVDVTWGSGFAEQNENNLAFRSWMDTNYLFPDPEYFIISHLPENTKWQLMEKPVTKDKYYSKEFDKILESRRTIIYQD